MKKPHARIGLILASSALLLSACNSGGGSGSSSASSSESEEEIVYDYESNVYQKLWNSKVIYNETATFVKDSSGTISAKLFYTPKKLVKVLNYTLESEIPADLFEIQGRTIVLKQESSLVPYFTEADLRGEGDGAMAYGIGSMGSGDTQVMFTEGTGIVMHHISFTYTTDDVWDFAYTPVDYSSRLPKTLAKLEAKEHLNVVFYGDSIFTGCHTSGNFGIAPMLDIFPNEFIRMLKSHYGYEDITMTNTAVGGTTSGWGKNSVSSLVNSYNPDLVVVGFGMNDGSGSVAASGYIANMKSIFDSVLKANPNAEIIDVATILANPDSPQNLSQIDYLSPTYDFLDQYPNLALCDMTTYSNYLYQRKRACDILSNNINHPSDFLSRQYVTNLLTTIGL